jgi:hypothetical protein
MALGLGFATFTTKAYADLPNNIGQPTTSNVSSTTKKQLAKPGMPAQNIRPNMPPQLKPGMQGQFVRTSMPPQPGMPKGMPNMNGRYMMGPALGPNMMMKPNMMVKPDKVNYSRPLAGPLSQQSRPMVMPAKKSWSPPRAAGKPAPYTASPGGSGVVVSSGANKPVKAGLLPKSAAGKPAAYTSPSGAQSSEQIVLQSRDISSYGPVWQSFSDYLTVPKGCEKVAFYLSFVNGSNSNPRFQDVRIKLAGKSLATLKDFSSQTKLTRNLTDAIGVGDSLLIVQALGPAGAQLTWQFTTPKVEITSVSPKDIALNKPITIAGKNFCETASANQVYFDKVLAPVTSATRTQLTVKVPASLVGGKADLVVAVGPSRSKAYKVVVKSAPKISNINMISTAPGQPITITGEGFSTNSAENQVSIGGASAEIISCSPTSITCIVPTSMDDNTPAWDVPIKVKTNGVDSVDPDGKGVIRVQQRVYDGAPYMP